MKKKILALLFAVALAVTATLAASGVDDGRTVEETVPADSTVSVSDYRSAHYGTPLSKTDKDYVSLEEADFATGSLSATDDVGRTLTTDTTASTGRQVAVFYTLGSSETYAPQTFSSVLDAGGTLAGGMNYWWGKPLFGWYHTSDTYVMRRHIEMLTLADVDYLVFDTTNGKAFTTDALKMMKLLHEYRQQGWDTPQVAFYTNTASAATMLTIYADIYEQNKYPDTWYMVDGKPLIIGTSKPAVIRDFFTFRASQWPGQDKVTGGYPWIDFNEVATPQADENGQHKVIPVSVAQNSSNYMSDNVLYGLTALTGGSRGRSYHNGADNITEDSYKYGYNFQEQWENAINSDAETALILQWNEWRAIACYGTGSKPILVFDTMTNEFSRDIEPMEGGFFDNYYMQMVQNIRRFKGGSTAVTQTKQKTIDIAGGFNQWSDVTVTYRDMANGGARRDALGYGDNRYTDNNGRNEMIYSKVTQDADNLYFYVQTAADITEDRDTGSWMRLYLDTDNVLNNSWNGYEYILNYAASSDTKTTVVRYEDGEPVVVGEVNYRVYGNQLMIGVPKAMLGLSGTQLKLNFKWADSRTEITGVEDFYTKGDAMPYGRFNYVYNAQ